MQSFQQVRAQGKALKQKHWIVGAVLVAASACGAVMAALPAKVDEAPEFAVLVKAGKLPPLAQRLGSEPEVVKPLEAVGKYGGTLRFGLRGSADGNGLLRMVGPQGLLRWDSKYQDNIPNVAQSFIASPDAKVYTFKLRAGMNWSDGKPFTADDVLFSMQDVVNGGLLGATPNRFMAGGKPAKIEKLDDTTVRFTFEVPYGDFDAELAGPLGQYPVMYAKHYCSQFHPKYNPKANDDAKAANLGDWKALFIARCGDIESVSRWGNPARPTLDPWIVKEPYAGGATRVVLERNPYFWQIDTAGNQLPYISTLSASIAQDVEGLVLDAIGGRIDFQIRHIDAPLNRPVLAKNREKGGYEFVQARPTGGVGMMINLNLTHKNPELRALFGKKDFRIALSLAIDRKSIIETALQGEGEPWQNGAHEDHPNFNKKLSTQYLELDPAKANQLLDSLGLNKRGPDGMRLLASGKPLSIKVDVVPTLHPDFIDQLQLVKQQWGKVGVDMTVNSMERTFFFERSTNSNDHDAAVWISGGAYNPGEVPNQLVPVHQDSRWGIAWVKWYQSGGKQGEEPPATIKERMKLYDDIRQVNDPETRRQMVRRMTDIAAEQFEVFAISKGVPIYGIRKTALKNIPKSMPSSFTYPTPAPTLPQTYFWTR